ncbi:YceI family protein [Acinetobacter indicus]|uniref:YceI family protein n=1 Tax=Acinetobacter indicus TaxID=756892 RepID=UPI00144477EF|nr:YceI family protein [Acinetobacter indicus]
MNLNPSHVARSKTKCLLGAAIMLLGISPAYAERWTLTPKSEVGFEIKSMGVQLVGGQFKEVQSVMHFDPTAPQQASTQFVLNVDSLQLSKPSLRHMILGEDLFYAQKYKTVSFKSTRFTALGPDQYRIVGNLTLRGVTRPVIFHTSLKPNTGNPKLLDVQSFTQIQRSDFGMKKAMGRVGEKVNIQLKGQWRVQ